jgi:hypothetical protein
MEMKMDWDYITGDLKFYAVQVAELIAYVLVVAVVVTIAERILAKFGIGHKPKPKVVVVASETPTIPPEYAASINRNVRA